MNDILKKTVTKNQNYQELFELSHDKELVNALKKSVLKEQYKVDEDKMNKLIQYENSWETMIIAINDQTAVYTFSSSEKLTNEEARKFSPNIPALLDYTSMANLDIINLLRAPKSVTEKQAKQKDKNKIYAHTKVIIILAKPSSNLMHNRYS